jgi:hypothetical protein
LPAAKVVAMPDSGFFLDYNYTQGAGYGALMRWVYAGMNSSGGVPAACAAANPDDPARCIFAEHVAPTLKTPFFPINSRYDSWQQRNILVSNNASQINAYAKLFEARVEANLLAASPSNGAFLDACSHHCGSWGIEIDGDSTGVAMQKWYNSIGRAGAKQLWANETSYPCAACCAIA